MIKKTALSISMFVLAMFVLVPLASADTINLTLTSPTQSGAPGSTVSFNATVVAITDKLGPVYLNGDSYSLASPLTLDDSGFLLNFPLMMSAGDSANGLLFTVSLPMGLAPGMYTGSFSILGGLNPEALGTLDTATFTINAASPVPEPGTWVLIGTGMAALLFAGFTRRETVLGDAA